jgi:hydroxymethylpyrimidine/phosphomethylpyrimidine kinase
MIRLLDADFIRDQMIVLLSGFPVKAAKTGMLGGADQVHAVSEAWKSKEPCIPLVVDPVMVATSGGRLLRDEAVTILCQELIPQATLVTPNMDEASVLWGRSVNTRADMEACAEDLSQRLQTQVLVKGGHLAGDTAADVLRTAEETLWFEAPRTPGVHTHGTGCTYSAAIATGLGLGCPLPDAVFTAKQYVSRAIAQHFDWTHPSGILHALNHLSQS